MRLRFSSGFVCVKLGVGAGTDFLVNYSGINVTRNVSASELL
jgi:hypothetical protein